MTRSTPYMSSSGKPRPQSTTIMSLPYSSTVMFLPISFKPPSGMIFSFSANKITTPLMIQTYKQNKSQRSSCADCQKTCLAESFGGKESVKGSPPASAGAEDRKMGKLGLRPVQKRTGQAESGRTGQLSAMQTRRKTKRAAVPGKRRSIGRTCDETRARPGMPRREAGKL